jgi:hypothetical protein
MRTGSILLLSAGLLLGATLAGAAPAPATDTPAVAAPAAQAAPSCPSNLFQQEDALPFTPRPLAKAATCGSCSPSPCQGLNINASCYFLTRFGYAIGKCHADSVCSDSGFSALCICRNGPEV